VKFEGWQGQCRLTQAKFNRNHLSGFGGETCKRKSDRHGHSINFSFYLPVPTTHRKLITLQFSGAFFCLIRYSLQLYYVRYEVRYLRCIQTGISCYDLATPPSGADRSHGGGGGGGGGGGCDSATRGCVSRSIHPVLSRFGALSQES
jgi:hypothetical protein